MNVFLLHHERELDGHDEVKLIGVYASRRDAEAAKTRTSRLPGFGDHPDGFSIGEYEMGRDHWTSGFATMATFGQREGESDQAA